MIIELEMNTLDVAYVFVLFKQVSIFRSEHNETKWELQPVTDKCWSLGGEITVLRAQTFNPSKAEQIMDHSLAVISSDRNKSIGTNDAWPQASHV